MTKRHYFYPLRFLLGLHSKEQQANAVMSGFSDTSSGQIKLELNTDWSLLEV